MNRRHLLTGLFAAVALPSAASAQTAEEQVIRQLKRQGYTHITLRRTLLGRTRIIATGPQGRREIVLNPSTGAILRDYIDRSDSDRRDRDDRNDDQEDREDDREDERDDRNATARMSGMTGRMIARIARTTGKTTAAAAAATAARVVITVAAVAAEAMTTTMTINGHGVSKR